MTSSDTPAMWTRPLYSALAVAALLSTFAPFYDDTADDQWGTLYDVAGVDDQGSAYVGIALVLLLALLAAVAAFMTVRSAALPLGVAAICVLGAIMAFTLPGKPDETTLALGAITLRVLSLGGIALVVGHLVALRAARNPSVAGAPDPTT